MNPFLEILIATVIWGFSGVFIKMLAISPGVISFFRTSVPAFVLAAFFLLRRRKLIKAGFGIMMFASILNAVRIYLYIQGVLLTTIGNAVILAYTWPIFTNIFGTFIGERFTKKKAWMLLLAFLGIVLVYFNKDISLDSDDFAGMVYVLCSTIIYSVTVIIFKRQSKDYSRTETVFFQNIAGPFVFLPFLFFSPLPDPGQLGILVLFGVSIGLVAFFFFFSALKKLDASVSSIMTYLEVIWAIAYSMLFFGEVITWNMVVGGMLIAFAAYSMAIRTPAPID